MVLLFRIFSSNCYTYKPLREDVGEIRRHIAYNIGIVNDKDVNDGMYYWGKGCHLAHPLAGQNVLLCDTDEAQAEKMAQFFKDRNIFVDWVNDGRECVTRFVDSPLCYFQYILLELSMPSLDGYETAEEIRQFNRPDSRTVPIIGMTGKLVEPDGPQPSAAGINVLIGRPVDLLVLDRTMQVLGQLSERQALP